MWHPEGQALQNLKVILFLVSSSLNPEMGLMLLTVFGVSSGQGLIKPSHPPTPPPLPSMHPGAWYNHTRYFLKSNNVWLGHMPFSLLRMQQAIVWLLSFFLFPPKTRWVWSSISLITKAWRLTVLRTTAAKERRKKKKEACQPFDWDRRGEV